ncbi:MAG: HAMP domain-containing sensor histidine kinase [Patescibacteria group bacterium]
MKLHTLIALLLLPSLAVLLGFIGLVTYQTWGSLGPIAHAVLTIDVTALAAYGGGIWYIIGISVLNVLVFLLLYLLLNRLIARPIRVITDSMRDFAKTQTLETMPSFSRSSKEVAEFTTAFIEFAGSVQEVHAHDLEISRVKSDFISTAAHQLRTPLTGIRWALEALEKEPLSESQKALVESATAKSHDLVAIVGTLLDISSIESGKHKYVFADTDLGQVASEVAKDFLPLAAEGKVTLYVEAAPGSCPKVRADGQQIKWVLNNLIENAIRYTPEGGSVRVSMATVPGRVQVLVRDSGIGIAPRDRNNIFERFYRAENAVAKQNKGNGLGLYIARTIATDHGGDLDFASNTDGPGTTFTLSIPTAG